MEILEKYIKEVEEDTKINQLNIKDVQLVLPSIRHKWVARLIRHKKQIADYKEMLHEAKKTIIESLSKDPKIAMSKPALERSAENHEAIKKIVSKIDEEELIVLYLEKVETILRSMTYDVKNLVDLMKIETT